MFLGEEETHEFYQSLTAAVEEARSLIDSKIERLDQLLKSCKEKFGKSVQKDYQKKKAAKNAKKARKLLKQNKL